jgi:hypothetical protein
LEEGEFIVHSSLHGVEIVPKSEFYMERELVADVATSLQAQEVISKLEKYSTFRYDTLGLIYWGLRITGTRFLGLPAMRKNHWAAPKAFLCSELLAELLGEDTSKKSFSPYDVYLLLVSSESRK